MKYANDEIMAKRIYSLRAKEGIKKKSVQSWEYFHS